MQINSCAFEQPVVAFFIPKKIMRKHQRSTSKYYLGYKRSKSTTTAWKLIKPEKELAQWSAKFNSDFKTKRQPRTIYTTIQSLNHRILCIEKTTIGVEEQ